MRKKWKQGMAVTLSALMLLGLAGCGNEDSGQAAGGAESKSSAEESGQETSEESQADSGQDDDGQAAGQEDTGDLEVVKILGRNYTYTGANGKTVTLKDRKSVV